MILTVNHERSALRLVGGPIHMKAKHEGGLKLVGNLYPLGQVPAVPASALTGIVVA
ncbi:hypothetical protein D3C81_1958750 [compost metagenome]